MNEDENINYLKFSQDGIIIYVAKSVRDRTKYTLDSHEAP